MNELFIRCRDFAGKLVLIPLNRVREIHIRGDEKDDVVFTVDGGVCFNVDTDYGTGHWGHALVDARAEMQKGADEA